jgi:hypothetical protein
MAKNQHFAKAVDAMDAVLDLMYGVGTIPKKLGVFDAWERAHHGGGLEDFQDLMNATHKAAKAQFPKLSLEGHVVSKDPHEAAFQYVWRIADALRSCMMELDEAHPDTFGAADAKPVIIMAKEAKDMLIKMQKLKSQLTEDRQMKPFATFMAEAADAATNYAGVQVPKADLSKMRSFVYRGVHESDKAHDEIKKEFVAKYGAKYSKVFDKLVDEMMD